MSESVGEMRSARDDLAAAGAVAGLKAADLTVAGARPTDAASWLGALRELAGRGDAMLAREAALRPARRRPPGRDAGGLLVAPHHVGGPRGPRISPASALFDLAA